MLRQDQKQIGDLPTGMILLPLKEACRRLGIAPRTYQDDRTRLPPPVVINKRCFFAQHEIDQRIAEMLAKRDRDLTGNQTT